jgi:carbon dioxide concentrating mechanism protein CcmM
MKSLIFNAKVGNKVAIGVSSTITGEIEIPDNKYVPPSSVITTQEQANQLPKRFGTPYENINEADKLVNQREKEMERNMLETSVSHGKINK